MEQPDHLRYMLHTMDYYQLKGYDFTEELSSLFLKVCVKCGQDGTRKGKTMYFEYNIYSCYRFNENMSCLIFNILICRSINIYLLKYSRYGKNSKI